MEDIKKITNDDLIKYSSKTTTQEKKIKIEKKEVEKKEVEKKDVEKKEVERIVEKPKSIENISPLAKEMIKSNEYEINNESKSSGILNSIKK